MDKHWSEYPTFPGYLEGDELKVPCSCGIWHTHGVAPGEGIGRIALRVSHCQDIESYYIIATEYPYQSAWGRRLTDRLDSKVTPAYWKWMSEMLAQQHLDAIRG